MNGPADIFPLEKEGLRIRRMEPEDLEPMTRLLGDPAVMRYMEPPFDRARTRAFLQETGFGPNPLIYGAERNGAFLGYVICHSWGRDAVELGWVLLPEYWGQGLAGWLTDMLLDGLRDRYAGVGYLHEKRSAVVGAGKAKKIVLDCRQGLVG